MEKGRWQDVEEQRAPKGLQISLGGRKTADGTEVLILAQTL